MPADCINKVTVTVTVTEHQLILFHASEQSGTIYATFLLIHLGTLLQYNTAEGSFNII